MRSKKRKEVENESPLDSMFQKQQTINDLQKSRETYNAILEQGQQVGNWGWTRHHMPSLYVGQKTTHTPL